MKNIVQLKLRLSEELRRRLERAAAEADRSMNAEIIHRLGQLFAKEIAPPPGKRYPLNMRTTRELREWIEAEARASGRSLVQEVEFRLEQSRNAPLPNPSKSAYDPTGW